MPLVDEIHHFPTFPVSNLIYIIRCNSYYLSTVGAVGILFQFHKGTIETLLELEGLLSNTIISIP